ncbi:MAG: hypothetical protein CMJ59_03000 [Planctomycetaceae bacterium]|nr:hypothetical protein [Planctomycetaceae bacterium]
MQRTSLWVEMGVIYLALGMSAVAADKRLLLLAQGPDGHPRLTHEYQAGVRVISRCLEDHPGLQLRVVSADGAWPQGPDLIRQADGIVLFLAEGAKWIQREPRRLQALTQLAQNKGGLVVLHWGMGTRPANYIDQFLQLFGACHGGQDRKYKVVQTRARVALPGHQIMSGIDDFDVTDEFYYRLKRVRSASPPIPQLTVEIDGRREMVAWSWQRSDGGRSFGFSGLHFHENWKLVEYRRLVAQAVLWTLQMAIPANGLSVNIAPAELLLERP